MDFNPFPHITVENQINFERVATEAEKEKIPCICGYYGRACRQMGAHADRFLCNGCPLAAFCK